MRSRRNIILAPHVDDEVIGCYSYLAAGVISDVVYFNDLTDERKIEAESSAHRFGFKAAFSSHESWWAPVNIEPEDTIFAPMIQDEHPDHKSLNVSARKIARDRKCKIKFYSVDMNVPQLRTTLPRELALEKKAALQSLFPSQATLLENEKYHLFQCIADTDVATGISCSTKDFKKSVRIDGWRLPELKQEDIAQLNSIEDAIAKYWTPGVISIVFYDGEKGYTFGG